MCVVVVLVCHFGSSLSPEGDAPFCFPALNPSRAWGPVTWWGDGVCDRAASVNCRPGASCAGIWCVRCFRHGKLIAFGKAAATSGTGKVVPMWDCLSGARVSQCGSLVRTALVFGLVPWCALSASAMCACERAYSVLLWSFGRLGSQS